MKKLLLIALMTLSASAFAQYPHHNHRHGGWGYNWVAPAIIGGIVTYELTRPPVVVQQQPIIVQPQQSIVVPYAPPAGFHWEHIADANCQCTRLVLVQN